MLTLIQISIHALLAESDLLTWKRGNVLKPFLSTLSLRRATTGADQVIKQIGISIHALLAESDERMNQFSPKPKDISIHALLAESDECWTALNHLSRISIHALLAESDHVCQFTSAGRLYFYPRSPCGERLHYDNYNLHCVEISIHALLAESD